MPKFKKSYDYCILWVRINNHQLLIDAMLPRRVQRISITNRHSEQARASAKRRIDLGFPAEDEAHQYYGVISSLNRIKGTDVSEHVEWIFSNFKPEFSMSSWTNHGAEFGLSYGWWGGTGTGYGPMISPRVGGLLLKHNIQLEISLYS